MRSGSLSSQNQNEGQHPQNGDGTPGNPQNGGGEARKSPNSEPHVKDGGRESRVHVTIVDGAQAVPRSGRQSLYRQYAFLLKARAEARLEAQKSHCQENPSRTIIKLKDLPLRSDMYRTSTRHLLACTLPLRKITAANHPHQLEPRNVRHLSTQSQAYGCPYPPPKMLARLSPSVDPGSSSQLWNQPQRQPVSSHQGTSSTNRQILHRLLLWLVQQARG